MKNVNKLSSICVQRQLFENAHKGGNVWSVGNGFVFIGVYHNGIQRVLLVYNSLYILLENFLETSYIVS